MHTWRERCRLVAAQHGAPLMIDYQCFCQIKYLREHQGLNTSQIAQEVSLNPRTVSYWLAQEHFRPRRPANRPSKLDPFRGAIRITSAKIHGSPHPSSINAC